MIIITRLMLTAHYLRKHILFEETRDLFICDTFRFYDIHFIEELVRSSSHKPRLASGGLLSVLLDQAIPSLDRGDAVSLFPIVRDGPSPAGTPLGLQCSGSPKCVGVRWGIRHLNHIKVRSEEQLLL